MLFVVYLAIGRLDSGKSKLEFGSEDRNRSSNECRLYKSSSDAQWRLYKSSSNARWNHSWLLSCQSSAI
uniref:Uncharacterized protein n=1 Tax=Triticum urartu TaxID=4572 RepID=A0A8R7U6C4_TRIUA